MFVEGICPPEFARLREAFERNFDERGEVGSAVAVTVDGELVVDLWGGWADCARTRPWHEDTLVNVYSCTKAATALCAHLLVDSGALDLDAPVASYWPEFAAGGKGEVLVRWLLCHRAGLMGPRRQLAPSEIYDWDLVCGALAESEPWLEVGGEAAYHAITFGHLVGEVVRRVSGTSLGAFLRERVASPLGLDHDLYIGCPEPEWDRCAEVLGSFGSVDDPADMERQRATFVGIHPALEAYLRIPLPHDQNSAAWRKAELPAVNGHMTARGLAGLYAPLANGGSWNGATIVSNEAVERMRQHQGPPGDLLIGPWVGGGFQWLAGYMNNVGGAGPNPRAFGHGGFGGSFGFADPEQRISYGYVMNKLEPMSTSGNDPRSVALTTALYESLAQLS